MSKENLQEELRKLDKQLQELRAKETPTKEDVGKLNSICDQIEEIQARMETEDRAAKLTAGLAQPTQAPPGLGQPNMGQRGFGSMGEYLQAVAAASMSRGGHVGGFPAGIVDRRLMYQDEELRSTGLETTTPSLGGFLVQTDYSNELLSAVQAESVLYPKCRKLNISTNSNSIKIPGIDEDSRASTRWGGILGYWENEGGSITASKPKFRNVELTLNKLTGLCYVTDEMLEDSSILENVIRTGFQQEFTFKIDDAIMRGDGSGKPLGILNAACLVSVTGFGSVDTIYMQDLANMYARAWPGSLARMEFFANVDTIPQLMAMNTAGTAGTGSPLWIPQGSFAGLPYSSLFGKPLHFIEQASTLGDVGDLVLADFSQYIIAQKGGLKGASSMHVAFTTDEMCFRFVLRIDGQPAWHSALTPYKGTNTLGPFVAIATR
jgi:HK97 family phage major capsid protein